MSGGCLVITAGVTVHQSQAGSESIGVEKHTIYEHFTSRRLVVPDCLGIGDF